MVNRAEVFDEIVKYFSEQYSWLGEQYAKELLYATATNTIQTYMPIRERIRTHLLLLWEHGWFKSSLLFHTYQLLGIKMSQMVADITPAAFRGSVETTKQQEIIFIPPECKIRRFIIITELGTITKSQNNEELNQLFLNALEEGIISVSLLKIARLSEEQKREISMKYNVLFDIYNPAMMYYETKTSFFAATYDIRYTVDEAFLSRWYVIVPKYSLNNSLTEYVMSHKIDVDKYKDVIKMFRDIITTSIDKDTQDRIKSAIREGLPSEIFQNNITVSPRLAKELLSFILANVFWTKEVSINDIKTRLYDYLRTYKIIHMTYEDLVLEILKQHSRDSKGNIRGLTFEELLNLSKLPPARLSSILRRSYNIQKYNDNNTIKYFAIQ